MSKKKKPRRGKLPRKSLPLEATEQALRRVALLHGTTVEEVRKQIQIGMLIGAVNGADAWKTTLPQVPRSGETLSPEEIIAYYAQVAYKKRNSGRGGSI